MPLKKKAKKALKKKKPVKAAKKKVIKKRVVKKKTKGPKENVVGIVTHYFPHVSAAVIKLKAPLTVGDTIKFKGHTTDFTQSITSMQIDRTPINTAKPGEEIGLLVNSRVRQHDVVCKA